MRNILAGGLVLLCLVCFLGVIALYWGAVAFAVLSAAKFVLGV